MAGSRNRRRSGSRSKSVDELLVAVRQDERKLLYKELVAVHDALFRDVARELAAERARVIVNGVEKEMKDSGIIPPQHDV